MQAYTVGDHNIMGLIKTCIEQLAADSWLTRLDKKYKEKYANCFPTDISHICDFLMDVYHHHINVKPGIPISTSCAYSCPWKYHEGWKTLIDQHYAARQIRPSSSQYTSPSFIIPKVNPTVLPHWVNDYQNLNHATIPDNYPLPQIDDILANCVKGKI